MARILITGGAGFIGSHLVEAFIHRGDEVAVFDNLATGKLENIAHLRDRFVFHQEDLRDYDAVRSAVEGMDWVCHQAALGSVPRSIADPRTTNDVNVNGTLNVLTAAKEAGVKRVVCASSSSIYGDTPELPKHEGMPFRPISPYAMSKVAGEEYARIFHGVYGLQTVALRYFNVFGPRQDPNSQYAAAIPKFVTLLMDGKRPQIYGDGTSSRDFTYVANVVHANILAFHAGEAAFGRSFNIGTGGQVGILELIQTIQNTLGTNIPPEMIAERPGEVKHSRAAIEAAKTALGYEPLVSFEEGIAHTISSFVESRRAIA